MKSKLTKAKEISYETKCKVLDRQGNRSISGVFLSQYNTEFHHVIPRSASGIGYEWNIVAITSEEHRWYHDHANIRVNGMYIGWAEEKCKFRKYAEENEYGVTRREWR